MSFLIFQLHGEFAMWRNFTDTQTRSSCPGPAPSHLSGLIGAALGFKNEGRIKGTGKWPVAPDLLNWHVKTKARVAARIFEEPRWATAHVNGYKFLKGSSDPKKANLRVSQMVVENPTYEIVVESSKTDALEELEKALSNPYFPLCFGSSQFRCHAKPQGIVEKVAPNNWATHHENPVGYWTPLTQHLLTPTQSEEIITLNGYLNYHQESGVPIEDGLFAPAL